MYELFIGMITITRNGRIYFDGIINDSKTVQCFYDDDKDKIGFRLYGEKNAMGLYKIHKGRYGDFIDVKTFLKFVEFLPTKKKTYGLSYDEENDLYVSGPWES